MLIYNVHLIGLGFALSRDILRCKFPPFLAQSLYQRPKYGFILIDALTQVLVQSKDKDCQQTAELILENIFFIIQRLRMNTEFPFIEDCCRNSQNIESQIIQEIHIILSKCRIITFTRLKHREETMITIRNELGKTVYYTQQKLQYNPSKASEKEDKHEEIDEEFFNPLEIQDNENLIESQEISVRVSQRISSTLFLSEDFKETLNSTKQNKQDEQNDNIIKIQSNKKDVVKQYMSEDEEIFDLIEMQYEQEQEESENQQEWSVISNNLVESDYIVGRDRCQSQRIKPSEYDFSEDNLQMQQEEKAMKQSKFPEEEKLLINQVKQYLEQFGYLYFSKLANVQFFSGKKDELKTKFKELDRISLRTTAQISCLYIRDPFSIELPKDKHVNDRYAIKLLDKLGQFVKEKNKNTQSKFLYEKIKTFKHIAYYANQQCELAFIIPQLLQEQKDMYFFKDLSEITIIYCTRKEQKQQKQENEGQEELKNKWYRDSPKIIDKFQHSKTLVLIIITELDNQLYKVKLVFPNNRKKPSYSGPLQDGMIINEDCLCLFVRQTCINLAKELKLKTETFREAFYGGLKTRQKQLRSFNFQLFKRKIQEIVNMNEHKDNDMSILQLYEMEVTSSSQIRTFLMS